MGVFKTRILPAISIVMPTYNMASYLLESIPSIFNQSFTDFELIIVDDGSTDQTAEVISSFVDSRIVYILREHDYIDSMNAGIATAKGEYIVRMDADDLMPEERLMNQFRFMKAHPKVDVCGGGMELFGDTTGHSSPLTEHNAIAALLLLQNTMVHPSVIMRRTMLDDYISKHGVLYDKTFVYAEDYRLWTCLIMEGYRFANLQEVMVKHRISENAVTSKYTEEMRRAAKRTRNDYLKFAIQQILIVDNGYLPFINEISKLSIAGLLTFQDVAQLIYIVYYKVLAFKR